MRDSALIRSLWKTSDFNSTNNIHVIVIDLTFISLISGHSISVIMPFKVSDYPKLLTHHTNGNLLGK